MASREGESVQGSSELHMLNQLELRHPACASSVTGSRWVTVG
jgi:hypothetical protein